jgi:hypothetical protein
MGLSTRTRVTQVLFLVEDWNAPAAQQWLGDLQTWCRTNWGDAKALTLPHPTAHRKKLNADGSMVSTLLAESVFAPHSTEDSASFVRFYQHEEVVAVHIVETLVGQDIPELPVVGPNVPPLPPLPVVSSKVLGTMVVVGGLGTGITSDDMNTLLPRTNALLPNMPENTPIPFEERQLTVGKLHLWTKREDVAYPRPLFVGVTAATEDPKDKENNENEKQWARLAVVASPLAPLLLHHIHWAKLAYYDSDFQAKRVQVREDWEVLEGQMKTLTSHLTQEGAVTTHSDHSENALLATQTAQTLLQVSIGHLEQLQLSVEIAREHLEKSVFLKDPVGAAQALEKAIVTEIRYAKASCERSAGVATLAQNTLARRANTIQERRNDDTVLGGAFIGGMLTALTTLQVLGEVKKDTNLAQYWTQVLFFGALGFGLPVLFGRWAARGGWLDSWCFVARWLIVLTSFWLSWAYFYPAFPVLILFVIVEIVFRIREKGKRKNAINVPIEGQDLGNQRNQGQKIKESRVTMSNDEYKDVRKRAEEATKQEQDMENVPNTLNGKNG